MYDVLLGLNWFSAQEGSLDLLRMDRYYRFLHMNFMWIRMGQEEY